MRLIAPYVGGGFGGKEDMTVEAYLGMVTLRTGRPCEDGLDRQESLLARARSATPFVMRYRTGATRAASIVAQDIDLLSDSGAYAYLSALVLMYASVCAGRAVPRAQRAHPGPHRLHQQPPVQRLARLRRHAGRLRLRGRRWTLLARELGLDPLELRRRNFVERGDMLPVGQLLETAVEVAALIDAV